MKMITKNLLETILRLSVVSSHDETRMNLNGVHVYKKDSVIYVESTDGHKATRETVDSDDSDINDHDLILCRKDVKKIKKFIATYKGKQSFDCELNDHSLVIKVGTNTDLISIYRINREFPRLDGVLPVKLNDSDKAISISFNPEYLLELFESLKTNKSQSHITLTFDSTNSLSPMLVEIENNTNQVGVLMPCKSSKSDSSASRYAELLNKKNKRSIA